MKNTITFLKELYKKPYGKAVFFFGFYLIFFIVIFIILGVGGDNDTKKNEETKHFDISYLEKYNYSFDYKVVLDNNTYNYVGNKNSNIYDYTYNGKSYYNENGKSYIKEDEYKEVDNPIKFNSLLDVSMIDKIINSAYIESVTNYANGDKVYNLLISSNTLNKIINDKDTDIDDVANKIRLSINNNFITEISYDFDSYCKNNESCNKLSVTISYKEYSEIS